MELFLPLPGLWSKNFFYKMFLYQSKGFKINFQNRKRNFQTGNGIFSPSSRLLIKKLLLQNVSQNWFSKQEMELFKQEMELFLPLPDLWSKTSFTKCFSFVPRVSKLISKTGNGIIQTGNGIISPTSRPLTKKLLLQNVFHFIQGLQI